MNDKIIIVNNGSTSKKYALYKDNEELFSTHYEKTLEGYVLTENRDVESEISSEVFEDSFTDLIDRLLQHNLIESEDDFKAIAIRVVAPGVFFQEHQIIDKEFLAKLDDVHEFAPLHIGPEINEINVILDRLPKIPLVAVSDSAFHKTMIAPAKMYSLPKDLTDRLGLYRFGYHGISVSSVVEKLREGNELPSKMIVCHLGGGASVTAVKDGKSVDTSMGFSPLEGISMATRAGDVDASVVMAIMHAEDLEENEMQNLLYKESGLKAISGTSGDTRSILEKAQEGDSDAELALNVYSYEIQKLIGAYSVVMGGVDEIVFTATIGERSAEVRRRICEGLDVLGVDIDQGKNKLQIKGEAVISTLDSRVKVSICPTREVEEMARIANQMI